MGSADRIGERNGFQEDLLKILPPDFAHQNRIVPLSLHSHTLEVGVSRTYDRQFIRDLEFFTGKKISVIELCDDDLSEELRKIDGEVSGNLFNGEVDFRDCWIRSSLILV